MILKLLISLLLTEIPWVMTYFPSQIGMFIVCSAMLSLYLPEWPPVFIADLLLLVKCNHQIVFWVGYWVRLQSLAVQSLIVCILVYCNTLLYTVLVVWRTTIYIKFFLQGKPVVLFRGLNLLSLLHIYYWSLLKQNYS